MDTLSAMKSALKREWENWVPISLMGLFAGLGALYWVEVLSFDVLSNDIEKAYRAYVEIGVAATGAIFAIVITLSLVAIQFASQEYSHRIMDSYIKSVMFRTTLIVYLGVIAANIIASMNLNDPFDTRMVGLSIVGSLLCLILLIPHFFITAQYLKPDFVMGKLLRHIDERYLGELQRLVQQRTGLPPSGADRLLPVVEMVERSIDKGDLTTTRTALELLSEQYLKTVAPHPAPWTDRYYLNHILRLGHKAVLSMDEESTAVQVVSILGDLGATGPDTLAAEHIDNLGALAFKRDADRVTDQVIDSLRQLFTAAEREETRETILTSYGEMVVRLTASDKERQLRHLTAVMYELARELLIKKAHTTALQFVEYLERIGRAAADAKRHTVVGQTVEAVQSLGIAAADVPETAEKIMTTLLRIERDISPSERELRSATEYARGAIQYALGQRKKAAAVSAEETIKATSPLRTEDGHGVSALENGGKPAEAAPVKTDVQVSRQDSGIDVSGLWDSNGEEAAAPERKDVALDLKEIWEAKPSEKPVAAKEEKLASSKDAFGGLEDLWVKKEG